MSTSAFGLISKVEGAELAGVDFFSFQRTLAERQSSTCTVDALRQELDNVKMIFREDSPPEKCA